MAGGQARRVLIGGYYGFANTGDEAILAAMLADLRALEPRIEVEVVSGDPEGTTRHHGVQALFWRDLPALLDAAQRADLIILGGGGLLHDYWAFDPDSVLSRNHYGISFFAGFPLLAAVLEKPCAIHAVGVGPLATEAGRASTRRLIEQAHLVTVRDAESRQVLESIGVDVAQVKVTADPAFALQPAPAPRAAEILAAAGLPSDEAALLGVALRHWDVGVDAAAWEEQASRGLDAFLERHHARAVFIPFQGLGSDLDDASLAHRIRSRMRHASRTAVLDGQQTPAEKAAVVRRCDLVLGMRLHSLVFAIAGGVPAVALAYDPKVRAAMAQAGASDRVLEMEGLQGGALAEALADTYARRQALGPGLAAAGRELAQRARDNAALTLGLIERRPAPPARVTLEAVRQLALEQTRKLSQAQETVSEVWTQVTHLRTEVKRLERELKTTSRRLAGADNQLQAIYESRGWAMLGRVQGLRLTLAPRGSRRERVLRRSLELFGGGAGRRLRTALFPHASRRERALRRCLAVLRRRRPAAPGASGLAAAEAAIVRANAHDVVCFPIIDWDFRFQRPQQLMSRFAAAGHRVFYLSLAFRAEGPLYELRPLQDNVFEVSLRGPDHNVYMDALDEEGSGQLFAALDALRREAALGATVSVVQLPFWWPVAKKAAQTLAWPIVYDCMDHHAGFSTNQPEMLAQEDSLLKEAALVTATSHELLERCRALNASAVLVPNACDYDHFADLPAVAPSERPVIGYYGAIAEWFDADLVADLAQRRPDWDFVLVGSTYSADLTRLSKLPNVSLPGEQPYAELPAWIARFDALLLPFKRIPLTEATNPVKLYEILAAGKPLVSVPLPEVVRAGDLVRLAATAEEFEREVRAALEERDAQAVERRRAFARENTWARRFEALEPRVRQAFPKASIVVVTYNNEELNRLCIESVYERTEWPDFELLVVDNASRDGTPAWLRQAEKSYPGLTVILNDDNRGFAAASNQGLEKARGDFLVLLNNDTVVTRGWLSALIRHLQADPGIGLVGSVTNAIANAARVEVGYERIEDMPEWAARYVREHDQEVFGIPMVAMFCVAMRRYVYGAVGPLDERFGVGMFEDDDYNARVRQLGLRIGCARDSFVHHWQRSSFRLLGEGEYLRIFEENRRKYEEKWGRPWQAEGIEVWENAAREVFGPQLDALQARRRACRGAVVFLPSIGWDVHLVQRPHHLARAFARAGYLTVFDSSNSDDGPQGFQEAQPNLFLYRGPQEALAQIPDALLWAFPYNFHLRQHHPASAGVVYDWIDDLSVFPYDPGLLETNHRRALREATLVACVARRLQEKARRDRPDALYLPNGVEYERFASEESEGARADRALAPLLAAGRPIAGYYGALAAWFDYELLDELSRMRPDWSFLLVGPMYDKSLGGQPALSRPNVLWIGPRDYEALSQYLQLFDVAMIPFAINDITLSTSPLKLYEYFAGGKPVVTTPMPECMAFPEVRVARTSAEFSRAIDAARADGQETAFRDRLRAVARANSWDARVEQAIGALEPARLLSRG